MTEDVKVNVKSIIKAIYLIEKVVGSLDDFMEEIDFPEDFPKDSLRDAVDLLNGVNSRLCEEPELKHLVVNQLNSFRGTELFAPDDPLLKYIETPAFYPLAAPSTPVEAIEEVMKVANDIDRRLKNAKQ